MTTHAMAGRVNQKLRTRDAIVRAAAELSNTGRDVAMPEIAKAALVSEATAYRYFPDLASLLREAIADQLPTAAEALKPLTNSADSDDPAGPADCADPTVRIAAATEFLLRHVLGRQGVARALIAATIAKPGSPQARPGLRLAFIDHALAPLDDTIGITHPAALAQLKRDLTVVVSAEALFSLTDQHGLSPEQAIDSIVHTATTFTRGAIARSAGVVASSSAGTASCQRMKRTSSHWLGSMASAAMYTPDR